MGAWAGVLVALLVVSSACSSPDGGARAGDESRLRTTATTAERARSPETSVPASVPEPTSTPTPAPTEAVALPPGDDTAVRSVIDGDTIVAAGEVRVRLIGVDTPETRDPRKPVQCFGAEASAYTRALLPPGTAVRLVADVERFDRYGRTLAYVYRLADGLFVNAALVREGYAQAYTYPPNVAHADELVALTRQAREAGRGLWSACGGFGVAAGSTPEAGAPAASGSGCDPAYPDACIPPPPPDLDCAQVPARRFRVLPPDPHGFDRDGDGLGCET